MSPVLIFFQRQKLKFLVNILKVFIGAKTWVSYTKDEEYHLLPKLREGILSTSDQYKSIKLDKEQIAKINVDYAKDFVPPTDIKIILKSLRDLGRS